jgi:3-oxoacyl-[acyl-carrier-protein] synthase II
MRLDHPPPGGHRVVVTGLGVFSSIGTGAQEFADGLRAGRSGTRPITAFDTTGYAHALGCEIPDFVPQEWIRNLPVAELGRATQFSTAAARMAVSDAHFDEDYLRSQQCLVSIGTTDGESADLDRLVEQEIRNGPETFDPVVTRRIPAGRLSAAAAQELGLAHAEAVTIPTACAAGNYAIGYGFDAVRTGEVDIALCGGADAMCRKTFTGFYRLGTIAPTCCQPFDRNRQGILTGEGAAVLILENHRSAVARGARIYAEILGYGLNCDAYHQVAPDQGSVAACMRLALDNAGVRSTDVDLISAHGTGTKSNDVTEARAIREVFDQKPPPVISIKSMIGHTMGAASALSAAACILAITYDFIPPTINHVESDPECGVDCVPNKAVPARLQVVQNNGLAFGGNNAVVILGRYEAGEQ